MFRSVLAFAATLLVLSPVYAAEVGHVEIQAEPGIRVILDGVDRGYTSAREGGMQISDIPAGEHTIRFEKEGFAPKVDVLVVHAGQVKVYSLAPLAPSVRVRQEGAPPAEEMVAKTGTIRITSLPIGCLLAVPQAGVQGLQKRKSTVIMEGVPAGLVEVHGKAMGTVLFTSFVLPQDETCEVFLNFSKGVVTGPVERATARLAEVAEGGDLAALDFELALSARYGVGPEALAGPMREKYEAWRLASGASDAASCIGVYSVCLESMGITAQYFSSNDDHAGGNGRPELYIRVLKNGEAIFHSSRGQDRLTIDASQLRTSCFTMFYVPGDALVLELWDADAFSDDRLAAWRWDTTRTKPGFPLTGTLVAGNGGGWVKLSAAWEGSR